MPTVKPKRDPPDTTNKRRIPRPVSPNTKRPSSASPQSTRSAPKDGRRCSSLSPNQFMKKSVDSIFLPTTCTSSPETNMLQENVVTMSNTVANSNISSGSNTDTIVMKDNTNLMSASLANANIANKTVPEKPAAIPQAMLFKMQRTLAAKKRDFVKLRKNLIQQQKTFLELFASVRELEVKLGTPPDDSIGDARVVSVTTWPAHDLLMLVRDDLELHMQPELGGGFGPQVLAQMHANLSPIAENVLNMGAEVIACRQDLINLVRNSNNRSSNPIAKNPDIDIETDRLHSLVAGTVENIKAKISFALELAKVPWVDRDAITKKIEKTQKDNMTLLHRIEELKNSAAATENANKEINKDGAPTPSSADCACNHQNLIDELSKERAAREALKNVVSAAESMLRVARGRIANLERQLKDTKAELNVARRKHKDLEQMYRHRETSYDARSRKLLEVSKTGEITIETLQRQRDALELRVKELHEQVEAAQKVANSKANEQRYAVESLQAKVATQERQKEAAEIKVLELEAKAKGLEDVINNLRERSRKLVDMERKRCLDYVPSKENEPTDRETEIWKELQATRLNLARTEEDLRQCRLDKENFLNSLSKIAQEGDDKAQEKTATVLLEQEKKIGKMQQIIDELRDNEKSMEQTMTQYENQMASLRLEVKRLRNYDCYTKDVPYQELQTELLDLHMQVESLTRERAAMMNAAASRALMLERHERAADFFTRVTRARRELSAMLDGRQEPQQIGELITGDPDVLAPKRWLYKVSRSLSSLCGTSADTWSALCAERARVLRLESAVLAQSMQLEREGRVRTQFERRRAILERQLMRTKHDLDPDSRWSKPNEATISPSRMSYRT